MPELKPENIIHKLLGDIYLKNLSLSAISA